MVLFDFVKGLFAGYGTETYSFMVYVAAMTGYVVLVGIFYQKLSRKDVVEAPSSTDVKEELRAAVKYSSGFALMSFTWFVSLALFMFFLAKSQSVTQILLTSMTVVGVTRVAAYINEGIAVDVAKLVPLSLLGVFLVDPGFFSLATSIGNVRTAISSPGLVIRIFAVLLFIEFTLRTSVSLWQKNGHLRE